MENKQLKLLKNMTIKKANNCGLDLSANENQKTHIDDQGLNENPVIAPNHKANLFKFDGKLWRFRYDGIAATHSDQVGFHYIQKLIRHQRTPLHVTKLVTWVNGEPTDVVEKGDEKYLWESGDVISQGDYDLVSGEVDWNIVTEEFDDEVLSKTDSEFVFGLLEKECKELTRLKQKGKPFEYLEQKQEIQEDIKEINAYLAKNLPGGKSISFPNRGSRDRASVTNAIRRAIKKLEQKHPALARHLKDSISTGYSCVYSTNPTVSWVL